MDSKKRLIEIISSFVEDIDVFHTVAVMAIKPESIDKLSATILKEFVLKSEAPNICKIQYPEVVQPIIKLKDEVGT